MKYLLIILTIAFCFNCGTTQIKSDPVAIQNTKLAENPTSGFGYKSSKMPSSWAKSVAPVVKDILKNLPEGYVLQITGHTDTSGPELPTGDKPGNLKISLERALTVYNALKNAGVDTDKMICRGVGSREPLENAPPEQQRRVTFKLVKEILLEE
jgi:outer membrane protein OmpA-like peptidoglycan-associated protein